MLFSADSKKFTSTGYKTYWNAVDKSVKFADTLLAKKEYMNQQKKSKEMQKSSSLSFPRDKRRSSHNSERVDRFHWKKQSWKK